MATAAAVPAPRGPDGPRRGRVHPRAPRIARHVARPAPIAAAVRARRVPETPVEQRPGEALVWTDGACSGNPGPGGWAAIVVAADGAEPVELSGGEPHTTNNRMEYTAALEGLRSLPAGGSACIVTDSRLMLDSMTKWIHGWKRKGWKTAARRAGQEPGPGDGARRRDRPPRRASAGTGSRATRPAPQHAHKALNDRADQLAVAAARAAASTA